MKIKRNKQLVFGIFAVCFANSALLGGIWFLFSSVEKTTARAEKNAEEVLSWEKEKSDLAETRRFLEETKEERAAIDAYFIEKDEEAVRFLEQVEEVGKVFLGKEPTTDISLDEDGGKEILSIKILANGTFDDIYGFIGALENFPAKLTLENAAFRVRPGGGEKGALPSWDGAFTFTVESFKRATP